MLLGRALHYWQTALVGLQLLRAARQPGAGVLALRKSDIGTSKNILYIRHSWTYTDDPYWPQYKQGIFGWGPDRDTPGNHPKGMLFFIK
jgi:hypothetical protein